MPAKLSPADVDYYKKNGYYLYKHQIFSPEKLAKLTAIFEQHLAEKGDKLSDELDMPHLRDPRLMEFLLAPEAIDVVEPLIGPNIGLWASHFICKDPFKGRATPWHEDSAYWKGQISDYDFTIVTIWLALDKSFRDNGCLRVIPGSHLAGGFSDYENIDGKANTFDSQIKNVDDSKAVYFELEKGEGSLHDARIVHGALANTSPHRRCGYTMRYFSTKAKVTPHNGAAHKLWLARGKDLAGSGLLTK